MTELQLQLRINKLPQVLQDLIGEYNVLHRKQTTAVFQELMYNSFCQTCSKYIFGYVYSMHNDDVSCCSLECLDNYEHEV